MDDNASNDPYVNNVIYVYDHTGVDIGNYQAKSTSSTPGFDSVLHQEGFWLRLKPSSSQVQPGNSNRLTYPVEK